MQNGSLKITTADSTDRNTYQNSESLPGLPNSTPEDRSLPEKRDGGEVSNDTSGIHQSTGSSSETNTEPGNSTEPGESEDTKQTMSSTSVEPEVFPFRLILRQKVDNSWSIYDLATKNTPISWEGAFKKADYELQHINKILNKYEAINGISYPYRSNIFKAFDLTRLEDVKAVFISAEPYSGSDYDGLPMATGLALSVRRSSPIPRSLNNLFYLMNKQIANFSVPKHADLTRWAKNGILLLNISLTVKPGESGSHSELWTGFTMKIIEEITLLKKNLPFILFGKDSNKMAQYITGGALIITAQSMYNLEEDLGDAFTRISKFLAKHQKEELDYRLDD